MLEPATPAPIAIFSFNRPDHTRKTLEALAANQRATETELTVFCDGARKADEEKLTAEVREVARTIKGFKSVRVVAREKNMGCPGNIIAGVKEMFTQNDRVIVIEDDILTVPSTLRFLNAGLEKYQDYKSVFNITAWAPPMEASDIPEDYPYDVFFTPRFNCWGWAMWKDRWQQIDWQLSDYELFSNSQYIQDAYVRFGARDLVDMVHRQKRGEINSWAIRADYARFKLGLVGASPFFSFTRNMGFDGTGTHCHVIAPEATQGKLAIDSNLRFPDHIIYDPRLVAVFKYTQAHQYRKIKKLNKWFRKHFPREY